MLLFPWCAEQMTCGTQVTRYPSSFDYSYIKLLKWDMQHHYFSLALYILLFHPQLMKESGLHFSCVFLIVSSGLFVL